MSVSNTTWQSRASKMIWDKYLDVIIKTKTPNPVPLAQRAAQDLEGYV
ncbi:MAG: hypothetical protein AAGA75_10190 [Cyanobacteria bacterium P01_E01_bin.6]